MKIKSFQLSAEPSGWLTSLNTPKSYLIFAATLLIIIGCCFVYYGIKYKRETLEPPFIDQRGRLFIGGTMLLGAVTAIATLFFYPRF